MPTMYLVERFILLQFSVPHERCTISRSTQPFSARFWDRYFLTIYLDCYAAVVVLQFKKLSWKETFLSLASHPIFHMRVDCTVLKSGSNWKEAKLFINKYFERKPIFAEIKVTFLKLRWVLTRIWMAFSHIYCDLPQRKFYIGFRRFLFVL